MSDASPPKDAPELGPIEQEGQSEPAGVAGSRFAAVSGRWTLVILTLIVLVVLSHRQIGRSVCRTFASYHAQAASDRLQAGELPEAIASVERALAWLPDDAALVYLRAQIHAAAEDWDASLADYATLTEELAPNFASAYVKRAEVHRECANFHDALKDLDTAAALSSTDDPDLLNHRAYIRALAGEQLDEAQAEIQLAIELYADQERRSGGESDVPAAYLDTLGYIQFRRGEYNAAAENIEKALSQLQQDREATLEALNELRRPVGPIMQRFDEVHAEIVYHRGLVRHAEGNDAGANEDFALAKDLGYTAPTTDEPTTDEPATDEPPTDELTADEPAIE